MIGFVVLSYGIVVFYGVVVKLVLDSYCFFYFDNKFKYSIFLVSFLVFVCNFVLICFFI